MSQVGCVSISFIGRGAKKCFALKAPTGPVVKCVCVLFVALTQASFGTGLLFRYQSKSPYFSILYIELKKRIICVT